MTINTENSIDAKNAIDTETVSPLVCFFPSHDGRTLNGTTLAIVRIAHELRRPLAAFVSKGLGQAVAINGMVQGFRLGWFDLNGKQIEVHGTFRALWVEDDILLNIGQAKMIADMINKADEKGWNMTAPYATGINMDTPPCPTCGRAGNLNWVYFHLPNYETNEIGRPFTLEEIQALKPYDKINGLGGLGFYYGDVNTDYVFYEGTYNGKDRFGMPSYSGIDWNYYLDNKIELRHFPILISHDKSRFYDNIEAIKYNLVQANTPIFREKVELVNKLQDSKVEEIGVSSR